MSFVILGLIVVGVLLLIPTAYAGLIGAPYVPTRRAVVRKAFETLGVGPGDTVVDLGAGDGTIVREARARGARGIGYELSPIMWLVAWWRTGGRVTLTNFYRQRLPEDTTIVFTFLMPENMVRVRQFLVHQHLPRARYVLSYMFPFKDVPPLRVVEVPNQGRIYVYDWELLQPDEGEDDD